MCVISVSSAPLCSVATSQMLLRHSCCHGQPPAPAPWITSDHICPLTPVRLQSLGCVMKCHRLQIFILMFTWANKSCPTSHCISLHHYLSNVLFMSFHPSLPLFLSLSLFFPHTALLLADGKLEHECSNVCFKWYNEAQIVVSSASLLHAWEDKLYVEDGNFSFQLVCVW